MSLDHSLAAWEKAGIIDAAAAARIRAYEKKSERPYALWAIIGLGLFALALGLVLIVAANWDEITDWLKLGVHLMLTAAVTGPIWWSVLRQRRWITEGALFLLGAVVIAGIALHAQVYQLAGPLWQSLLLWLALMTPVMLLLGRTRLSAYGWAAMFVWGLGALAFEYDVHKGLWLLADGLAMASPALLILLSLLPCPDRERFADGLRDVGILTLLGGASIAHVAWSQRISSADAGDMAVRLILPVLVAFGAIWAGRRWNRIPVRLLYPLLAGTTLAVALAIIVPHPATGWLPRLIGVLAFVVMWGAIAHAAVLTGWRALFGIAISAIGIRIFIVYIELFGSLAITGVGLIVTGVIIIALAVGWRRLFRLAELPQ